MGVAADLGLASGRTGSVVRHRPQRSMLDRPLVLVVDDDPVNLRVASSMLSSLGVGSLLAADGGEAVALACELDLDLILMDLQMPVLDGFGATAQIRRFEREHARRRVPVVAHIVTLVDADHPLLRDIGIDAVLRKPSDVLAIRECVMRWCPPAAGSPATVRTGPHPHAGQGQFPVNAPSTRAAS